MKKLFHTLALAGVFAVGAGAVVTLSGPAALANSQKAKAKEEQKKPDDTKKPPTTAAGKGTITIKPDAKGRFRLTVKNADGKTLLMTAGNGFESEKEARDAIEEIKGIMAGGKVAVEKGEEKDK